jgi:hypothetical protein
MTDSLRRSSRRSKKQAYTVGDIVQVSVSEVCRVFERLTTGID